MPRPRKCRFIADAPVEKIYKPRGIRLVRGEECLLSHEGLEALRLADLQRMEQAEAAELMNISRPTFSRLVNEARHIVAKALVNGWALKIEGGNFMHGTKDDGIVAIARGCGLGRGCRAKRSGFGLRGGLGYDAQRGASQVMVENNNQIIGEKIMDKIAVSVLGDNLDANIDPRFGRAQHFLIVDPQTLEFEHIDNSQVNSMAGGAGIQTAERIAKIGVKNVITGMVGPKAAAVLSQAGINVLSGYENITVRDALKKIAKI